MSTNVEKHKRQGNLWQRRKKQLRPFLESVFLPIKTIWSDPLGRPGAVIFGLILLMTIFAPLLATHDPNVMNEKVEGIVIRFGDSQWDTPSQVGDTPLNALAWVDETNALAVGTAGSILHMSDRDRWVTVDSPTEHNLWAVDASSPGFAIAVGEHGTILQYDGTEWNQVETPTNVHFYGVAVASAQKALVVGQSGTVLSWDGQFWTALATNNSNTLRSVSLTSEEAGVIVGDRGTILHYENGSFSGPTYRGFTDATFRRLNAVQLYSADIGFAIGERGTIMGYDGQNWYTMRSPESRELRGVTFVSADQAYIVGIRGIVLEYQGNQWEVLRLGYRRDFRGISGIDGQALAFGTDPYINELAPPSREHFFGTTHLGRDIWSQVMYGSRTALLVGILAALVVNILGLTVGLVAGYYRGRVDNILMRIVDVMYGLPLEPFAIILVLIFKPSLWIIILAIGLLTWRTNARIIRSQVLTIVERPFIKAAKVAGASNIRIMLVHIAPNILPLAFLQLAVAMGYAITAEATLSFLGLGPPQVYSWGTILHAARLSGAWRTAWWWVIPPGIFICITVVSVFLVSRSLEVLTNPRLRGGNNRAPRRP